VDGEWVTVSTPRGPTLPTPRSSDGRCPPAAGDPQATTLVNTYVRTGPGTTFPAYGIAPAAASALVIGKSTDGAYWVVRLNPATVARLRVGQPRRSRRKTSTRCRPSSRLRSPSLCSASPAAGAATATAADYVYVRSGRGLLFCLRRGRAWRVGGSCRKEHGRIVVAGEDPDELPPAAWDG
jgi:hypothetical protein